MEAQMSRSNQDRRRWTRPLSFVGGGGVEGLLVLGGTLAIASLVAVFTFKTTPRRRRSRKGIDDSTAAICTDECEKLGVVHKEVQSQSPVKGEVKLVSRAAKEEEEAQSQQEVLTLSDDSTPESIASCEDYCVVEEFRLPANVGEGKGKKQEHSLKDKESSELGGGEADEEDDDEEEEEDYDDDDSDEYEDDDEEESDSVGYDDYNAEEIAEGSSSGSNHAVIWPGEMVEESLPEYVKEFKSAGKNYGKFSKGDKICFNHFEEHLQKSTMMFENGRLHQVSSENHQRHQPLSKSRVWLIVPVLLLPVLLSLIHYFLIDKYVLDLP